MFEMKLLCFLFFVIIFSSVSIKKKKKKKNFKFLLLKGFRRPGEFLFSINRGPDFVYYWFFVFIFASVFLAFFFIPFKCKIILVHRFFEEFLNLFPSSFSCAMEVVFCNCHLISQHLKTNFFSFPRDFPAILQLNVSWMCAKKRKKEKKKKNWNPSCNIQW